ncbi:AAA family ATPase [Bifidobacterium amazonense]|uniref:AAA family ATPase n=1 Tax=Bifidobacterium amazonense TaxID=2809027 RepID=A0ABS9VW21_9BIFI|nr:AAA family ATPase [Bifidobacterium amazonense]MCH9276154.1 AAA family ATPase [Bifidobacterium amazonense]
MSDIEEIEKKFKQGSPNGAWKQFINSIEISGIHGWEGQRLDFNFPVMAVVGENGVGKSTFLKAAACAYANLAGKTFYPSKMFVSTQWDEDALANATITYQVREGDEFKKLKWRKVNDWGFTPKTGKPERNVFFLDVSRTLPLDATAGYARIAKLSSEEAGAEIVLSDNSVKELSYVLGRGYSNARFIATDVNENREVGLLNTDGHEFSQFHQGAGEDEMLDMFKLLQEIPAFSLLIIDEVENSLHPQAQRRFVNYLLNLALKRKIQVILSTHSPFVLDTLPQCARVMLMRLADHKEIINDVSTNFALSTIDEVGHPELYVYVEDDAAQEMFWSIIRLDEERYLNLEKKVAVKYVGGWDVVDTLGKIAGDGKLPYRSIGIVDGDMRNKAKHSMALPGTMAPERQVFLDLQKKNWCRLDERFNVSSGVLFKYLNDATLVPDHHLWTKYVGDNLHLSKDHVWRIIVAEWCRNCYDETDARAFIDKICQAIQQ